MADDIKKRTWADVTPKTSKSVFGQGDNKQPGQEDMKLVKGKKAAVIKQADSVGASSFYTRPVEYRPEFASPDRWWIPRDRTVLNNYWRMFYATDPVAGSVIDMYVEMPLSEYTIVGEGVEGEIQTDLEYMCEDVRLIQLLTAIMREFLVVGEAIPHLFFEPKVGYWTDWSMHKPEVVEVLDTQMLGVEPILMLQPPTEEINDLKRVIKMTEALGIDVAGKSFLEMLTGKKKVPLEPLNATFIPRVLHAYDTRGTSLFTRLWRTWMYEDACANATIQTAKRHAGPVKVVSMGDVAAGFVPTAEQENALLKALAQAEMDPHAWVLVPPTTKFEAWGTTDRIMGLRTEYDVIERLKLMALGTSKDFISGASTFASAQAGLQVFLSRLLSFRTFVEENFVYPKLFDVLVRARKWEVVSKADADHGVRTSKGRTSVKPKIRWAKSLKPRVDKDLLDAYAVLVKEFSMRISQRTICAAADLEWQDELRKSLEEDNITKVTKDTMKSEEGFSGSGLGGDFGGAGGEEVGIEEVTPEAKLVAPGEKVPMHAGSVKEHKYMKGDSFLSGVGQVKVSTKVITPDDLIKNYMYKKEGKEKEKGNDNRKK